MTNLIETAEQYYELFKDDEAASIDISAKDCSKFPGEKSKKSAEALKLALDIRKFEIDLYWKRATYFWVLIGAALVAFIAVSVAKDAKYKAELCLVISSLGLVFSCAWLAVNKGSKFWQENWEKHVDMLEGAHHGPLYKTVFNSDKGLWSVSGSNYSVSKINLVVSIFVVILWVSLLLASFFFVWNINFFKVNGDVAATICAGFSIILCGIFLFSSICKTRISDSKFKVVANLREKPLQ
jgi:uncharacterized membrane protein